MPTPRNIPYNYNGGKKTKYRCPTKQLGFGSAKKIYSETSKDFKDYTGENNRDREYVFDNIEAQYLADAWTLIEQNKGLFRAVIAKVIWNKALRETVWDNELIKFVAYSCSRFDSSKGVALIGFVLYELKLLLRTYLSTLKKEKNALKELNELTQIQNNTFNTLHNCDENTPYIEVLHDWLKDNCTPLQRKIYRLSYIEGYTDGEIGHALSLERSYAARLREEIVKLIIYHKAEIEKLFDDLL